MALLKDELNNKLKGLQNNKDKVQYDELRRVINPDVSATPSAGNEEKNLSEFADRLKSILNLPKPVANNDEVKSGFFSRLLGKKKVELQESKVVLEAKVLLNRAIKEIGTNDKVEHLNKLVELVRDSLPELASQYPSEYDDIIKLHDGLNAFLKHSASLVRQAHQEACETRREQAPTEELSEKPPVDHAGVAEVKKVEDAFAKKIAEELPLMEEFLREQMIRANKDRASVESKEKDLDKVIGNRSEDGVEYTLTVPMPQKFSLKEASEVNVSDIIAAAAREQFKQVINDALSEHIKNSRKQIEETKTVIDGHGNDITTQESALKEKLSLKSENDVPVVLTSFLSDLIPQNNSKKVPAKNIIEEKAKKLRELPIVSSKIEPNGFRETVANWFKDIYKGAWYKGYEKRLAGLYDEVKLQAEEIAKISTIQKKQKDEKGKLENYVAAIEEGSFSTTLIANIQGKVRVQLPAISFKVRGESEVSADKIKTLVQGTWKDAVRVAMKDAYGKFEDDKQGDAIMQTFVSDAKQCVQGVIRSIPLPDFQQADTVTAEIRKASLDQIDSIDKKVLSLHSQKAEAEYHKKVVGDLHKIVTGLMHPAEGGQSVTDLKDIKEKMQDQPGYEQWLLRKQQPQTRENLSFAFSSHP